EERQHGELGGAREHDHTHGGGLDLAQSRGRHRHAGDDPPRDDADEERNRGESAISKGGNLVARKVHGRKERAAFERPFRLARSAISSGCRTASRRTCPARGNPCPISRRTARSAWTSRLPRASSPA